MSTSIAKIFLFRLPASCTAMPPSAPTSCLYLCRFIVIFGLCHCHVAKEDCHTVTLPPTHTSWHSFTVLFGFLLCAAYMPMPGYSGPYMPYGGYPGMIMGGMPMQYGVMGYPMQQQAVPGVMPAMQQQQRQQQQSGSQYGYSIAQAGQRSGGGRSGADVGSSSRPSQSSAQPKREGTSEGVQLPESLHPTAGDARASAAAYRAS